jgi:hypothetical protein
MGEKEKQYKNLYKSFKKMVSKALHWRVGRPK